MNKTIIAIVIAIFGGSFPHSLMAQPNVDSLKLVVAQTQSVEERVKKLFELAEAYVFLSLDSTMQISHRALQLAKTTENSMLIGDAYYNLSAGYLYTAVNDTSRLYLLSAIQGERKVVSIIYNTLFINAYLRH